MNVVDKVRYSGLKESVTDFSVGDGVKVYVKIIEGTTERIQLFAGTVIARRGSGIEATFTVRRVVSGQGVERVFPLHRPRIDRVEVVRKGKVRRAKLFYLRTKIGKAARVKELRTR